VTASDLAGALVLRLHGARDLRLTEEEAPKPRAGEALVAVRAVGICGSDLHWYSEGSVGDAAIVRPLVLGHEASGVITSGGRAGQRVAIDPAIPCERCEPCLLGRRHLCIELQFAGHGQTDGALRSLLAWPERHLVPVPDALDDLEVALLEPLGVALHAIDLGRPRLGGTVGVIGCGPIGLFIIALARLAGAATILASDALAHRVAAAQSIGADHAVQAGPGSAAELLRAIDGRGVDVAFEAAGNSEALDAAIEMARPAADVIVVGIPAGDRFSFSASVARRKGLDIRLSRRMADVYPRAIDLVAKGRLDVRALVTDRYPLGDAAAAFASAARRDGIKVLVEPSHTQPEAAA